MPTLKKISVAVLVAGAMFAAEPAARADTSRDGHTSADDLPLAGGLLVRGVDLNEIVFGLGLQGVLGTPPK
ncbi:hypothetical protein [Amycolatopsis pittospori]|uniref:hypothetical protein n=1 Tax=Amycolatopsis pittospori TaxID=2749434 RepID=UPI0015F0D5F4|nr:hypothetical protein [Amycolatopsis pittospori]